MIGKELETLLWAVNTWGEGNLYTRAGRTDNDVYHFGYECGMINDQRRNLNIKLTIKELEGKNLCEHCTPEARIWAKDPGTLEMPKPYTVFGDLSLLVEKIKIHQQVLTNALETSTLNMFKELIWLANKTGSREVKYHLGDIDALERSGWGQQGHFINFKKTFKEKLLEPKRQQELITEYAGKFFEPETVPPLEEFPQTRQLFATIKNLREELAEDPRQYLVALTPEQVKFAQESQGWVLEGRELTLGAMILYGQENDYETPARTSVMVAPAAVAYYLKAQHYPIVNCTGISKQQTEIVKALFEERHHPTVNPHHNLQEAYDTAKAL